MANKSHYEIRKFGPITLRRDYSISQKKFETPDFLEMQRNSVEKFLKQDIETELKNIYPIEIPGKVRIEYVAKSAYFEHPKKSEFECIREAKQKGSSYVGKLKAKLRQINVETGEIDEAEVVFAEIPIMTYGGSFIINGSEKVIVSQLIRSTGAYFGVGVRNKQANDLFNKVEIIPQVGSWVEIYHKITTHNPDAVRIHIDKNKSFYLTTFLKALGFSKEGIYEIFGKIPELVETFKRDKVSGSDKEEITRDAQEVIYRLIRKGDRMTAEGAKNLIPSTLFNEKRYSLTETGRFTLNRKLNVIERIANSYLAQDIISKDGKVLYKAKTYVTQDLAKQIHEDFKSGLIPLYPLPDIDEDVYGNQLEVEGNEKLAKRLSVARIFIYSTENEMNLDRKVQVLGNDPTADENFLLVPDLVATISYYFNLIQKVGMDDDPDSLINKRIVTIGELLQNQFRVGLIKLEKNTRERIATKDIDKITPKNATNNKPIFNQFKSFFNTSKLSQFMDQCNPLAEMSNKRRITSLGPRGLNRDTAQFEVRDVHPTHFGRICPIETPEGPNIGLILNLASFAKIDRFGFLQSPYFRVKNRHVDFSEPIYLTAIEEIGYTFTQSTIHIDKKGYITDDFVMARKNNEYMEVKAEDVDYVAASNRQMTSIAASAIPFLENDDANRALMGSNMQRQAVPVLSPEAPLVATGVEADVAKYSSTNIRALHDGIVTYIDSQKIKVQISGSSKTETYFLRTFERSNQGTLIHQTPIVKIGQEIKAGDLLVDGPSMKDGEMALGKNVLVGFTTWNGYNYEDAVILSERLVKDDVYTSIHIEEQTIQFRHSKAGEDWLTDDIPNASNYSKRFLDENGIVRIGSEVSAGDILVGRTSPKGEENPTPEEKLMAAIFGQKTSSRKDTSLKVRHGHNGTVVDVEILSRDTGDQLEDGIEKIVKVSIAQKRKIRVGDKMAGRHGNKGVVSIVLPVEEMPYLEDGTPLDILLNPQGVPSRMNIGQVLELALGSAAKVLGTKFATPIFDGITHKQVQEILEEAKLDPSGKAYVYSGQTGEKFDNPISVGIMYYLKLYHMVDDKMHARSVGPYSLITQQPLGGKSQNGGQRFGEMETWAIESYGAANVLQELLTYKSDNINGRNQLYNALSRGTTLPKLGMPESFNVLAYELRGLGIKLEAHENLDGEDDENEYIETKYNQQFDGGSE
ncbi:DNA-directed RNA polymerase subunit beta [Metamycoplasma subdolum]|uniref:DNA-directed RNA polymerase subunit beta n=2 Tax=Metamycoplasma subdolum TaxID=92407 RepID=A0A3L9ZYW0_9BACT|nr:DNA-directed RNA polymerase subunit beta [Metamycoplasma subdolum]RMA77557.1 DNA-directed RNA polymerase subunit beta [Metamycoplasma subdolum]WPB50351.1 DNA-directed RNA polymerase subunit beta [Metamycoplasma subdolum]